IETDRGKLGVDRCELFGSTCRLHKRVERTRGAQLLYVDRHHAFGIVGQVSDQGIAASCKGSGAKAYGRECNTKDGYNRARELMCASVHNRYLRKWSQSVRLATSRAPWSIVSRTLVVVHLEWSPRRGHDEACTERWT